MPLWAIGSHTLLVYITIDIRRRVTLRVYNIYDIYFLYLFLSFLYPFLCTSLHSALSGVESGASCAITEGPAH